MPEVGVHVLIAHMARLGHHHDAAHAAAHEGGQGGRTPEVATGATPEPGAPQRPNPGPTGEVAR